MLTANQKITVDAVTETLGRHLGLYRRKKPFYQTEMLNGLESIWRGHHGRVLDIGGGTGVIAQCIRDLLPAGSVETIDVVDRFCKTLDVHTGLFDGRNLPYPDGAFDAATINNVVHHVPVGERVPLFRETRRVLNGPLYIKDHEAASRLDHMRLAVLDLMGNVPFGGMVSARYLSAEDWQSLARDSGFRIAETRHGIYRSGVFEALFPNELEIVMRWEPV